MAAAPATISRMLRIELRQPVCISVSIFFFFGWMNEKQMKLLFIYKRRGDPKKKKRKKKMVLHMCVRLDNVNSWCARFCVFVFYGGCVSPYGFPQNSFVCVSLVRVGFLPPWLWRRPRERERACVCVCVNKDLKKKKKTWSYALINLENIVGTAIYTVNDGSSYKKNKTEKW